MFEWLLLASRIISILVIAYLITVGLFAMWRRPEPVLHYGRTSVGLIGIGMFISEVEHVATGMSSRTALVFACIGVVLMATGTARLFKMYRKFPRARYRTLNLLSLKR